MQIVYLDGYSVNPGDLSWSPLEQLGAFEVFERTPVHQVIPRCQNADIIITNKVRFGEKEFAALPHLQLLCVAATGYDNIHISAARKHGVTVCNIRDYSTMAVAQNIIAHLLNITNSISHYAQSNREGRWAQSQDFCYWDSPFVELYQKKAAIIGFGHIGQAVAKIFQALGMHVLAVSSKSELPAMIQKVDMQQAFREADVITLCCPLTPDNKHFVSEALLQTTQRNCILINTARGALVDETALLHALDNNRLSAYCADVMEQEPPTSDNLLLQHPKAHITQHIAWATIEARQRIIDTLAANIQSFINNKPQNTVE